MLFNSFSTNRRLRDLEEQMEKLRRQMATRDLDWDEMRARCKRLLDRTAKQVDALDKSEPPLATEETPSNLTTVATSPDRMARIKQQLDAARASAMSATRDK